MKAEREKIMNLAKECGASGDSNGHFTLYKFHFDELEAFYKLAQKEILEQAAKVCEKKWRKEDSFDSHANAKAIRQLIRSE